MYAISRSKKFVMSFSLILIDVPVRVIRRLSSTKSRVIDSRALWNDQFNHMIFLGFVYCFSNDAIVFVLSAQTCFVLCKFVLSAQLIPILLCASFFLGSVVFVFGDSTCTGAHM